MTLKTLRANTLRNDTRTVAELRAATVRDGFGAAWFDANVNEPQNGLNEEDSRRYCAISCANQAAAFKASGR